MQDQAMRIRLPAPLKEWLAERARDEDRSMNAELVQLIKAAKRAKEGKAA